MKMELVRKTKIEKINFKKACFWKPRNRCPRYCYLCKDYNKIERKDLKEFIRSKTLYIYRASDLPKISRNKKCPWCEKNFDNLKKHIKEHKIMYENSMYRKGIINWYVHKVHLGLYEILLKEHLRKGKWDAFGLMLGGCQLCVNPNILWNGKKNKEPLRCALATSPKNRMRCVKGFGIDIEALRLEGKYYKYGFVLS